ncbi:MAG TPA: hypothetical protein VLW85_26035 [Myxococcales bacterium]|nr:hypothetical protein [Myxococcales bacterium]
MKTWIALLLLAAPTAIASEKTAVAVVVDWSNPRTDITSAELRAIYLGQQREWADGSRIVALELEAGAPEHDAFNSAVLEMSQPDIDRYWVDQRMRGASGAPRTAPTPGSLMKLAGKVKGVIGYVPLKAVDASVKVLKVDGVAPGKPGYAIEVD